MKTIRQYLFVLMLLGLVSGIAMLGSSLPAIAQEDSDTTTDEVTVSDDVETTDETTTEESHVESDGTKRDRIEEFRTNVEDRRAEFEANKEVRSAEADGRRASTTEIIEARKEEHKARLHAKAQERIKNLVNNMKNRMLAAVARLTNVADRIETRAEKLEDRGVDVDVALGKVADARAELDTALAILNSELDTEVDEVLVDENPRTRFATIREKIHAVGAHIRSAHKALRESVAALKEAVRALGNNGVSDAVRSDASDREENDDHEHEEGTADHEHDDDN